MKMGCFFGMENIKMNKQKLKEAILGTEDCTKEETPLCQFATFQPDKEMV